MQDAELRREPDRMRANRPGDGGWTDCKFLYMVYKT
jgi:hypothetical protein